jgi:hypothetical protein
MKTTILLILCIVFARGLTGQSRSYFSNDTLDQVVYFGAQYGNENYFLIRAGDFDHQPSAPLLIDTEGYVHSLVSLDSTLQLSDSIVFEKHDGYYFNPFKLVFINDTIFVAGRAIREDGSDMQIFLSSYTRNLQLIGYSVFGDSSKIEIMSDIKLNNRGHFIVPAKILSQNLDSSYFAFFEISKTNELIYRAEDPSWTNLGGPIVLQLPESKLYHFIDEAYVNIYDSMLVHQATIFPEFHNWFAFMYRSAFFAQDKYFVGGIMSNVVGKKPDQRVEIQEDYIDITYYLVDSWSNSVDSGFLYLPDTLDFCGGLDCLPDGSLCYGGIHNALIDFDKPHFAEVDKWIVVNNANYLTQTDNWFFRYGGDANYDMYGLYLTTKNECIVYSTRYDWQHNTKRERDILIMKIDSTGLLVGDNYNQVAETQFCLVYPNPGNNELNIKSYNLDGVFEMYNLQGVRVLNNSMSNSTTKINTTFLDPGVYLYRILDANKEIMLTGKWVKK